MLLCAVLLTASLTAQEFGQRKGFRGIVAKKDKPTLLNEVEVSTSAVGDTYATAARTVTVLTAKEIQELPVNTINEVLEYVAGLDVRQRGPHAFAPKVCAAGFSSLSYSIPTKPLEPCF